MVKVRFHKQRGDTIVEVLFAMAIIGLTLGIGYGVANRAIVIGRDAQEQTEASKFVEAQLEKLIIASDLNPVEYFSPTEPQATTVFCINETATALNRLVTTTPATQCRFGPVNQSGVGRYGVTIVRSNNNLFTITARWDNTRGNYESTATMVYRTYNYTVAVAPPAPAAPTPPPSPPLSIVEPFSVSPGVSSATLNSNVTGTPTTRSITLTRVSTGTSATLNVTSNNFTLGSLAPGESYNFTLFVEDSSGATVTKTGSFMTNNIEVVVAGVPVPLIPGGKYNGHTYYYSDQILTWDQANAVAQSAGGHLVTITSAPENTFVSNMVTQTSWLGLTDSAVEGTWRWVTGEGNAWLRFPTTGYSQPYSNWSSLEPNDYPHTTGPTGGQDYALINWPVPNSGAWDDQGYYGLGGVIERHRFVIEFDY